MERIDTLDKLNEIFQSTYQYLVTPDWQEAYDITVKENEELVHNLELEDGEVLVYEQDFEIIVTPQSLSSKVLHQIDDIMCNVGCNRETALKMFLEENDLNITEENIKIGGEGDGEMKILKLY